MTSHAKKGFTLIELLVVIAIIAILAVAVILTLNPAELLRQSRDTTRISDLNTLKSAIALYVTDQSSASGFSLGASEVCFEATLLANVSSTCGMFPSKLGAASTSVSRAVNGTGWIPVNFSAITSGAPVGALPLDPSYSPTQVAYFYAYISSSTTNTYKLAATLESQKYSNGGSADAESGDGGTNPNAYETGTALNL